jgi:Zn-dependent protease
MTTPSPVPDPSPPSKPIPLAGIFALLFKFGSKLLGVGSFLLKGLKLGKAALFTGTLAAYAYVWSWKFAAVLMLCLTVHEMGHVWAMKRFGIPHSGIHFIPFLGAAIVPESIFPSRKAEAFCALMGPIWGGSFAIVGYLAYLATGLPVLAGIASWFALVNAFNLIPVLPLDGGRVMASVTLSLRSAFGKILFVILTMASILLFIQTGFSLVWFVLAIGLGEAIVELVRTPTDTSPDAKALETVLASLDAAKIEILDGQDRPDRTPAAVANFLDQEQRILEEKGGTATEAGLQRSRGTIPDIMQRSHPPDGLAGLPRHRQALPQPSGDRGHDPPPRGSSAENAAHARRNRSHDRGLLRHGRHPHRRRHRRGPRPRRRHKDTPFNRL